MTQRGGEREGEREQKQKKKRVSDNKRDKPGWGARAG